jgi:hypothetical protein
MIWLGFHKDAHKAVMMDLHSSSIGGHSGITTTYHKIKALFAWPHMKDIQEYMWLNVNTVSYQIFFNVLIFLLRLGKLCVWIS